MPNQDDAFLQAARSLVGAGSRPRRYHNIMRSLAQPVLLIHGDRDRLVPLAARGAAAAKPKSASVIIHDVRHPPRLEDPYAVIDTVLRWLDRRELGAGRTQVRTNTSFEENR